MIAENWPAIVTIVVTLAALFAIAMAAAMYFGNDM
jgi:hypothetical protein